MARRVEGKMETKIFKTDNKIIFLDNIAFCTIFEGGDEVGIMFGGSSCNSSGYDIRLKGDDARRFLSVVGFPKTLSKNPK
jgi:hypothetical protein